MAQLKNIIKRLAVVYHAAKLAKNPKRELKNWQDYLVFRRQIKDGFSRYNSGNKANKLLVISLMGDSIPGVKEEAFLVKAIQAQGLQPVILTSRGWWANKYYQLLGVSDFIYFEDYLLKAKKQVDNAVIDKVLRQIETFDELMAYEFDGVKVGRYICSTLVRKTYTGNVDLKDSETRKLIRKYLYESMLNCIAAKDIYTTYQPNTTLFLERGCSPYGEFFDLSVNSGLNTIQWNGCHRDSAFTLKRYNEYNVDQHPASLSSKTWDSLKKMEWRREYEDAVRDELFQNYTSGNWFAEVGTQFNKRIMEQQELYKQLGLDPGKKTAVIFPHLFWDATFFWGVDLFDNYREWFVETVKAACKNSSLNWLVKLHPANVVKLNRDGYQGELVEKQAIRKHIGELPKHVKIMEPDTSISTFSLFSLMDFCLTVRGTIGIESAFFGIPVFTAGTGRYEHHGFTIDSETREEYIERLGSIHTYPPLSEEQKELAQKFAYGTFILRPLDLESMEFSYKRDSVATSQVEYLFHSMDELLQGRDFRSFGDWAVTTRDEDYIDQLKLGTGK